MLVHRQRRKLQEYDTTWICWERNSDNHLERLDFHVVLLLLGKPFVDPIGTCQPVCYSEEYREKEVCAGFGDRSDESCVQVVAITVRWLVAGAGHVWEWIDT